MRIVVALLIAVTAGFWLLAWWLIAEPIGAGTSVPSSRDAIVIPEPAPTPRPGASTTAAGAPREAPRQPERTPASSVGAAPSAPAFPAGAVVDPFADGGPRPVFVEPARPAPRVPSTDERPAQLAPPPMEAGPPAPLAPAQDDAAARQRSGSAARP